VGAPASPVGLGEFQEDPDITGQMRAGAVKVEDPDRNAVVIAAQPGIDRLADDPVHAGEGADVDDAVASLGPEPDGLAHVEHHFAIDPSGGEIRLGQVGHHRNPPGFRAIAQAEARVSVPSLDFSWRSDPLKTSHAEFAIIGTEVNGKYFDEYEKS